MRKDSKADFVSLDVTGVKELKLVSDEAGNGVLETLHLGQILRFTL